VRGGRKTAIKRRARVRETEKSEREGKKTTREERQGEREGRRGGVQ